MNGPLCFGFHGRRDRKKLRNLRILSLLLSMVWVASCSGVKNGSYTAKDGDVYQVDGITRIMMPGMRGYKVIYSCTRHCANANVLHNAEDVKDAVAEQLKTSKYTHLILESCSAPCGTGVRDSEVVYLRQTDGQWKYAGHHVYAFFRKKDEQPIE